MPTFTLMSSLDRLPLISHPVIIVIIIIKQENNEWHIVKD